MRRRRLVATVLIAALALLAFAAAGAALAGNGGFAPATPRSPNADRTSDAYYLILGITSGIFVLVESALLVFIFRFRSRGRPRDVEGPQIRGHTRLEVIWTVIPVLLLAAIAGFVFYKLPGIQDVPAASASGGRLEIGVEGHQFYWEFRYPSGARSVDTLTVPVDRNVRLTVTSPDVAHSWWAPELGGKIDAIPGQVNHTWFRAERIGRYRVRCAELCGIQHAVMLGWVRVVSENEYARFLANRRRGTADLARETFQGVCAKCHGLSGAGAIGPSLQGQTDAKALAATIRHGTGMMPAVGATWNESQVNAVVSYIRKHIAKPGGGTQGGS